VGWLVREVMVKFIVLAGLFAAVSVLMPIVVSVAGSVVSPTSLTSAWSALPAGLWWFLDWFQVGFGVPIVIAAWLSRFVIRRLPVVG
jgi:hypothetical protein